METPAKKKLQKLANRHRAGFWKPMKMLELVEIFDESLARVFLSAVRTVAEIVLLFEMVTKSADEIHRLIIVFELL